MSGWSPLTAKGKNSVTDLSDADEVGAGTHFLGFFLGGVGVEVAQDWGEP